MWQKEAFQLEIKRRAVFIYDFWLKMIIPPAIQVLVAYYLWDGLYKGHDTIGGYTFSQMILYYVIAASVYQVVQPEVGIVLRDIYDGTLTKFLFYPLSFIQFKFIGHLSQMFLVTFQSLLAVVLFSLIFGFKELSVLYSSTLLWGICATMLAGYLFFIMAFCLEIFGFWFESVWGLVLMLQFVTNLLGGKLLPLAVFPKVIVDYLMWTPFPYLVSFPTKIFLGEVTGLELMQGCIVTLCWSLFFTWISQVIWRSGSYNYSGTGM